MPQVTVYVRDEDLDKWKAIEHKSQFLHDAIHGTVYGEGFKSEKDVEEFLKPRPLEDVAYTTVETLKPKPLDEYPGYMIHRLTGQVVDTIYEEPADGVTKEMVDYLKKNNRYV